MPWKERSAIEERRRFVARLLDGEGMSEVCREFGISRKNGHKTLHRYEEQGLEALTDRSKRLVRYANQLPMQIEQLIVRTKREKPHGGARKIRKLLVAARSELRHACRARPTASGNADRAHRRGAWYRGDRSVLAVLCMRLDLTDEETFALLNLLVDTIEADRYPMSPRIRLLREILGKFGEIGSVTTMSTCRDPHGPQTNCLRQS